MFIEKDTSVSLKIDDVQAIAYLGKADELLRWSSDLRGLQLPQLPTSLLYPWQPADRGPQLVKAGSAEPQQSHTEQGRREVDGSSTTSSSVKEKDSKTASASCSDSDRDLVDAALLPTSVSPAPEDQSEAVSVDDPAINREQQPNYKQKQGTEHSTPDSHAHHIWSSWLRWQDRSVFMPCLATCVTLIKSHGGTMAKARSW